MATFPSTQRRSYWLKTLHQWHWMSAAASLLGLMLFAATGLTLNNAARIEAVPETANKTLVLPHELLAALSSSASSRSGEQKKKQPLAPAAERWLDVRLGIRINKRPAEFSPQEIYLSLPEPGADAWLSVDLANGAVEYERSDRGWIAYFNDLHKGRHTGIVWSWFIDVFAAACLVFALSGLFLLALHAGNRPASWPLVSLGFVLPVIVMLLFIH